MTLFDKAKQFSLPEFARNHGYELKKQGTGFTNKKCPCCNGGSSNALSIFQSAGIWRWNCFRSRKGGTTVDFAAMTWGISTVEAARRLCNEINASGASGTFIKTAPKPVATVSNESLALALDLILGKGHSSVKPCLDYLASRGISEQVVTQAVRRGIIRFLPADPMKANRALNDWVGIGNLTKAGLLKEGSKWPAISFRPIVSFFPGGGSAEFRLARNPKDKDEPKAIRYGTTKWPWFWKNAEKVKTIRVVEGVIDMLSLVEMGLPKDCGVMAIPGASSWQMKWFSAALKVHPQAQIILSLDNDAGGEKASTSLVEELAKANIHQVSSARPKNGDWNADLMQMKNLAKAA